MARKIIHNQHFYRREEKMFKLIFVIYIGSEGGTGEDWRINPHLNFGNFIENNNNIWKKLVQILT